MINADNLEEAKTLALYAYYNCIMKKQRVNVIENE